MFLHLPQLIHKYHADSDIFFEYVFDLKTSDPSAILRITRYPRIKGPVGIAPVVLVGVGAVKPPDGRACGIRPTGGAACGGWNDTCSMNESGGCAAPLAFDIDIDWLDLHVFRFFASLLAFFCSRDVHQSRFMPNPIAVLKMKPSKLFDHFVAAAHTTADPASARISSHLPISMPVRCLFLFCLRVIQPRGHTAHELHYISTPSSWPSPLTTNHGSHLLRISHD